jgi:hypothetical protein
MKLAWLLRGRHWRTFHLHRCRECGRRFCDEEPGSWADFRDDQWPELCSPLQLPDPPRWEPQPRAATLPGLWAVLPRLRSRCEGGAA